MSEFGAAGLSHLPGLLGIDHVGIAVADLNAASPSIPRRSVWWSRAGKSIPNQAVEEVMLVPPHGDPSAQVQLVAALADDSTVGQFLNRRGPGLHHLAYRVSDMSRVSRVLYNLACG